MRIIFLATAVVSIALIVAGVVLPTISFLLWIGIALIVVDVIAFLIRAIAGRQA